MKLEFVQYSDIYTFTYRMDSDFPIPYAWVDRILPLPAPEGSTLLQRFITSYGKKAVAQGPNLADNKVKDTGLKIFLSSFRWNFNISSY